MKIVFYLALNIMITFSFFTNSYSLMIELNPDQLVRDAELIVDGKVTHVISYWNDEGTVIHSRADIEIDDVLKGDSLSSIQVEYPGGIVGDIGMRETGAPSFTAGEEVILFLKKSEKVRSTPEKFMPHGDVYHVVAGAQGHYTVTADGFAYKGGFTAKEAKNTLMEKRINYESFVNMITEIINEE
jgi:molybdopterin-binding protein